LRPHWSGMIQKLKTLGPKEIQQRWQETRRLLRDNGVEVHPFGCTIHQKCLRKRNNPKVLWSMIEKLYAY
ncbi:MAG: hypothetical protein SVR94_19425, partial [Pseudomonadota bacterium]|nr:hypothetical protein [Pseudomonadota bacterium]